MDKRIAIEGSFAVAEAVKMADVDVVAAYPITPQTHIVERLAEMIADGELHAAYIPVESEHSAMCACSGASAVGARTFTASAGQGFLLMHEVLYWVAAVRQPVVMVVTNRAVGPPMNIWGDHSDVMTARDTGWIQIFASNNQEIFDLVFSAYRIAEDPKVLTPVIVNVDGFTLSHVVEPLILPDKAKADNFLPKNQYPCALHPDRPMTHGTVMTPDAHSEAKRAQDEVVRESAEIIGNVWKDFGDIFGRYYSPIECYKTDNAKTLILSMGSLSETAMEAVDRKREKGEQVGLITLRLWRPFPFKELYEAVKDAQVLVCFDRCFSLGGPGGPVAAEIRSALFGVRDDLKFVAFVGGICGREVYVEDFEYMIDKGSKIAETGPLFSYETVGIRG